MSTTPYPGPDEVIIPSRIYFDEGKRIDVKVWPKTIQLTGPTKDLNKVFKTLEEYDDWWHQFKKKNPDAFRKDAKYVKSINGLFLIQKRLYQIPSYQVTHGNIIANMNCTSIHSILMRRNITISLILLLARINMNK